MVIGNGLVAKRFDSYGNNDDVIVFASGVSNSKTKNPESYNREIELLGENIRQHDDKQLVYFSTCSIYDIQEKGSAYVQHKLYIEDFIKTYVKNYRIFRISNLAGISANPNTLLNFYFNHVKNGVNFDVWANACRNLIDIDDAFFIIDHILKQDLFTNQVINIANPVSYPVKKIIREVESFLDIRSNYIEIEKGTCFDIDTSVILPIIQKSGIQFGNDYLEGLLQKYYKH